MREMSGANSEGQRLVVGVAIEQPSAESDEAFESAELFGACLGVAPALTGEIAYRASREFVKHRPDAC